MTKSLALAPYPTDAELRRPACPLEARGVHGPGSPRRDRGSPGRRVHDGPEADASHARQGPALPLRALPVARLRGASAASGDAGPAGSEPAVAGLRRIRRGSWCRARSPDARWTRRSWRRSGACWTRWRKGHELARIGLDRALGTGSELDPDSSGLARPAFSRCWSGGPSISWDAPARGNGTPSPGRRSGWPCSARGPRSGRCCCTRWRRGRRSSLLSRL